MNQSLNSATRVAIVFLASSVAGHALGQDGGQKVRFVGSLDLGYKQIEFTEDRIGAAFDPDGNRLEEDFLLIQSFDESIAYLGLGGAAIYGDFSLSVSAELPIDSTDLKQDFNVPSTGAGGTRLGDLERVDYAVTLGYRATDSITVFGGYKYGETELDFELSGSGGAPPRFMNSYTEDGLFLGGSYGLRVGDLGNLSFSVAYAWLSADYEESGQFGTAQPGNTNGVMPGPTSYDGDADGFSYGVEWSGPLTKSIRYNISYRYQKYELDGSGGRELLLNPNVQPGVTPGVPTPSGFTKQLPEVNTEEVMNIFSVGIDYVF